MEGVREKVTYSPAGQQDVSSILAIIKGNLKESLTSREVQKGFLHYEPTVQELLSLINGLGVVVAKKDGDIVGYLILMSHDDAKNSEFFRPFISSLSKLKYKGRHITEYNFCLYAQVATSVNHRSLKTFRGLYRYADAMLNSRYDVAVGEIDSNNLRSIGMHTKVLHLIDIGTYNTEHNTWHVLLKDYEE